jgi:CPA2 family monovalent cation:H+ antiporter-2
MGHLPTLIQDLALILCAAAITSLLFKKLKQPVVLGYILTGLLVGPHFHLFPSVSDLDGIKIWAEIGVIFLLFSLGLEFSFKKLAVVGGTSAISGIFEISMMLLIGYSTGKFLGWSTMDSIFLGGILSISSTTIIIRAFEELNVKNKKFAGAVLGILIIEDIVAVLLLVVLSTLSLKQQFEGSELLLSIVKLIFFLCLWFLAGIFLLPSILKAGKKLLNDETMVVVSIGLCFLMVVLATNVGFSAALGAFIMGSILAETTQAEKIEHLIKPVKDLFGAVFFVSVGMLLDTAVLLDYAGPVLLITLVVILGKTLNVTIGSLLAGQPLKQSLQAGTSMSQIGEFSFIIATLGLTLNVVSFYLYPIAVGVSVITTFFTPYMMRSAEPLFNMIQRIMPPRWLANLNRYSSGAQTINAESDWKIVLRSYLTLIVTNSVIIIGLILLSSTYLAPFIASYISYVLLANILTVILTLAIMSPFVWALTISKIGRLAYANLWLDRKYNRGPLVMLEVIRNVLAVVYLYVLLDQFFPPYISIVVAIMVMVIVLLIFSQRMQLFYSRIEHRFLTNLNARQQLDGMDEKNNISPWDAHLAYFSISPNALFIGQPLAQLEWREKFGINIASIERGKRIIDVPSGLNMLFPYDKIAVIGTDEQLQHFRAVVEPVKEVDEYSPKKEVSLHKIIVDEHNHLRGKTIRNSGIREMTSGLVVGIERQGKRLLNPDSGTLFEWNDVIWIVGDRRKIQQLNEEEIVRTAAKPLRDNR